MLAPKEHAPWGWEQIVRPCVSFWGELSNPFFFNTLDCLQTSPVSLKDSPASISEQQRPRPRIQGTEQQELGTPRAVSRGTPNYGRRNLGTIEVSEPQSLPRSLG